MSTGEAMSAESDDPAESSEDVPGVDEPRGWLSGPWYRSSIGLTVVGVDVALTVVLALLTTTWVDVGVPPVPTSSIGTIPAHVYGFSVLGALGFVFTALIDRFDSDTYRLLRYNFRLPAALPLGAGVYILSDVILGTSQTSGPVVLGLVFLSGLYVNLAYKRLGALARRLLPNGGSSSDKSDRDSTTDGGATSSGDSAGSTGSNDGRGGTSDGWESLVESGQNGGDGRGENDGERDLEPEAPRRSRDHRTR